MKEEKSALDVQISGNHYKTQKLQPIELVYKLGATPCFCKLAKYLTRDKGDKKINLQKARHCIQLEQDLEDYALYYEDSMEAAWEVNRDGYKDKLIKNFSDNEYIQSALVFMFAGIYPSAVKSVEEYAESLGINLDE